MEDGLKVTDLGSGVWAFTELAEGEPYVDAYLICGEKRALLFDSLMRTEGLYTQVRRITPLPVDVVLSHGHGDHVGVSTQTFLDRGCDVYMDSRDVPILKQMFESPLEEVWFRPLADGQVFDLGGRTIEVIALPGHTPGSVVLLDRENQLLFTGDAIGSTHFWMQLPHSLPLSAYLGHIRRLYVKTAAYPDLRVHVGHRYQAATELSRPYIEDTMKLTEKLISGEIVGEAAQMELGPMRIAYRVAGYGQMVGYCYNPEKL